MASDGTDNESSQVNWQPSFDLMLDEARRALDGQVEIIGQTRGRATGLVGFGSLLAAALGFSTDASSISGWQWAGVIAFGVALAAALFVLSPRQFRFALLATRIDKWFDDPNNHGNFHMTFSAARAHEENYNFNKPKIMWMQAGVFWAMLGVMGEAVFLTLSLVVS